MSVLTDPKSLPGISHDSILSQLCEPQIKTHDIFISIFHVSIDINPINGFAC